MNPNDSDVSFSRGSNENMCSLWPRDSDAGRVRRTCPAQAILSEGFETYDQGAVADFQGSACLQVGHGSALRLSARPTRQEVAVGNRSSGLTTFWRRRTLMCV